MIYKSGSRVVQKVIQTACKSRPNVIQKVLKSRQTMSHMVCHTAGHTATGGPAKARSHDGFPIGKAREACGIGYVLPCVFVRISGHFCWHVSVAAAHFWLQFHVQAIVFFNVLGMVFDVPRCGTVILFLDLPLRTG